MKKKQIFKIILFSLSATLIIMVTGLALWTIHLNGTIEERMKGQRWAAPTDYFAAPERFIKGQSQANKTLQETVRRLEYTRIEEERSLQPGDYSLWSVEICRSQVTEPLPEETDHCWALRPRDREDSDNPSPLQILALSHDEIILEVYEGSPPIPTPVIELEPELFAQFYGGKPILRHIVKIGDVTPRLLNAIMAVEDSQFLEHRGVSLTGIFRALLRNLKSGHIAEGGSTITQQLIKNYFLTNERTFKRKITEILMALLLESKFSKDDILETYINEVYMGQEGPFEIHGVSMGAKHLFEKPPHQLSLAESALLAGIIRGPNIYSPFKNETKSLARRNFVLKRMLEVGLIDNTEYEVAMKEPLPKKKPKLLRDLAPFFVDAVKYQLKKLGIEEMEGLQIYTTLNMRAQEAATQAVSEGIKDLESTNKVLQKYEKKAQQKLQAVLISANPTNGFVEAVVGGRGYSETQLNRAVMSRRQVGSIFKPFVFLAALSLQDSNGMPYSPLTPVQDEPFTVKYDKQTWSPQNYDNKYEGTIPLFRGLSDSLNAATSKLALQVGLKKVAELANRLGIDSPLTPVPSLSLGSASLTPFEVLQSYDTLARRGEVNPLTFAYKVTTGTKQVLYEFSPARNQVADPLEVSQVVSMMEQGIEQGTGRAVRALGFSHPAAGKTGTTSDLKDAWFGGFTPLHTAIVWVGFDQPATTGLTGAGGAVPIWTRYMKAYASRFPPMEFTVPDDGVRVVIDPESSMVAKPTCPRRAALVFRRGAEPTAECWLQHY